ncbi:MAG: hypothetical protein J7L78_03790 [Dehalococcoidales bacterium]|nr:hypothetical protein [Dehalococcoidales bacterium]
MVLITGAPQDENKSIGDRYEEMIEKYQKMISEVKTLSDNDAGKIPSSLLENLADYDTNLDDIMKKYKEVLESQIDIHKQIQQLAERGGLRGFSTINQILATKKIALAAVLMAFSSIGFSISSAILSVVS